MAAFDSDLRAAELDVKGIRTDFARIRKLFDSRDIRGNSSRRVRDDLRHYINYLAANLDSEAVGSGGFDSDSYGVPSDWSRDGNLYSGISNSSDWTKLRNRLKTSQRAFTDGGSNVYSGAPHVVVTIDSDEELVFNSLFVLLKAHFADWLKSDPAEKKALNIALRNLTGDSELLEQLTNELASAYNRDRSAMTDFVVSDLNKLESPRTINDAILNPLYKFNQYATLATDSDIDANYRGRLWRARQQLARIVINGIQFDSEYGGGETLNFGRNALIRRLNGVFQQFNRQSSFTHTADIFFRFYNYFDFQWIRRDSDGAGNLTDSDSKGYSLKFQDHVVPGLFQDTIDDSEQILNYIKRIEFFANFFAKRLGSTDSDKLENVYDSEYTKIVTDREDADRPSRSNYYHYHPSFIERFKNINRSFVDKILVDGYLHSNDDSDWTAQNRAKLWDRLASYLAYDDSAAIALFTRLLNVSGEDSDLGAALDSLTITTVAGLDSEDLQSADGLQLFFARQTVNIIDSDSELQSSLTRNIIDTIEADSDYGERIYDEVKNTLDTRFFNDSDEIETLLGRHTKFIHDDVIAYMNEDSEVHAQITNHVLETFINDSDQRMRLENLIRPDFVTVSQEHIVHDSEGSYTSFTYRVPRNTTTGRLYFNRPRNNTVDPTANVKVYLNGLLLSSAVSYNKLGSAKVNSSEADVSSVLISTSDADPYITVNLTANAEVGDILTIQYMTTRYR